jgi:hypothetical protein
MALSLLFYGQKSQFDTRETSFITRISTKGTLKSLCFLNFPPFFRLERIDKYGTWLTLSMEISKDVFTQSVHCKRAPVSMSARASATVHATSALLTTLILCITL